MVELNCLEAFLEDAVSKTVLQDFFIKANIRRFKLFLKQRLEFLKPFREIILKINKIMLSFYFDSPKQPCFTLLPHILKF